MQFLYELNRFILLSCKESIPPKISRMVFQNLVRFLCFFLFVCGHVKAVLFIFLFPFFFSTPSPMLFFHQLQHTGSCCHHKVDLSLRRLGLYTERELTLFLRGFISQVIKEIHSMAGTGASTLAP